MPKSILVDSKKVRKSGQIQIPPIPVNQYTADPTREVPDAFPDEFSGAPCFAASRVSNDTHSSAATR